MTCSVVDRRPAERRISRSVAARSRSAPRPRAVAVARAATAAEVVLARLPGPYLVLLLILALVFAAVGCGTAATGSVAAGPPLEATRIERLINLQLSPGLSGWLVGPVAVLATPEEERRFLALGSDAEAEAFIEEFWERRDPMPLRPDNPLRETFEERAQTADRLYREGGRRGRQTARGTIHVLFGEPARTDYEIARDPRDPPIEVWFYETDEAGLAGEPPAPYYRFIKRGEITEFYLPRTGVERARPVRPGQLNPRPPGL